MYVYNDSHLAILACGNAMEYFISSVFLLPSLIFVLLQLLRQQIELIGAEGVTLEFDDDAVREIARMAFQLNKTVENIGARRLHTVLERIMETISFEAAELEKGQVRVDELSKCIVQCEEEECGNGTCIVGSPIVIIPFVMPQS